MFVLSILLSRSLRVRPENGLWQSRSWLPLESSPGILSYDRWGYIPESRISGSRRARSVVLALPLKNDAFPETSRPIEGRILH